MLWRRNPAVPALLALILGLGVACGEKIVIIGHPSERYDHNRTLPVAIQAADSAGAAALLEDGCYAPLIWAGWPVVGIQDCPAPADGLVHAVLVPVFTGVPLPLSASGPDGGDRADLLAFLAAGPMARAGIERPDATGDLEIAEREFRSMLDFLASAEALEGSRDEVAARLTGLRIKTPKVEIIDGRFNPLAFADRLAVHFGRFWFILFKAPEQPAYTRLVVVPDRVG